MQLGLDPVAGDTAVNKTRRSWKVISVVQSNARSGGWGHILVEWSGKLSCTRSLNCDRC